MALRSTPINSRLRAATSLAGRPLATAFPPDAKLDFRSAWNLFKAWMAERGRSVFCSHWPSLASTASIASTRAAFSARRLAAASRLPTCPRSNHRTSEPRTAPCPTRVAMMTHMVENRIRSRWGKGDPRAAKGMESAAARLTAPRSPVKPTRKGGFQLGAGSRLRSGGQSSRGKYVTGKTQTKRTTITVTATMKPAVTNAGHPSFVRLPMISRVCSPQTRKVSASMHQVTRSQIK